MQQPTTPKSIEWITLTMILGNYAIWWLIISNYTEFSIIYVIFLSLNLCWQSSLIHEIIHGHPTPFRRINDLLGTPPLALIFPYQEFKISHLKHHINNDLTIPDKDPESYFYTSMDWASKSLIQKAFAQFYMTLLGRLLVSPMLCVFKLLKQAVIEVLTNQSNRRRMWLMHLCGCVIILHLVTTVFLIPLWVYLLCAYIAQSLIQLRSFYEHRPALDPEHRIVIIESNWFFKLLFLNNNFHATHHRYPNLSWYQVEIKYRSEIDQTLYRNGGFYYKGYYQWLKFLICPVHSPILPESNTTTEKNSNPL